ncbi:MAG: aldehyde dehydrogenase family protein, partial [Planctomycetota bacterium]
MTALRDRPLAGHVQLTGRSAIGGRFIDGPTLPAHAFHSLNPGTGENIEPTFHPATDEQVDSACLAAWDAFGDFSGTAPSRRARLLETIATEVRDIG